MSVIESLITVDDDFKKILSCIITEKLMSFIGRDKNYNAIIPIRFNESPHILIAGATGSGKSVALNTVICSLLVQNKNSDIRFLMIDTKRVELSYYSGLPELILPIAKTYKDAIYCLKVAIKNMDDRYKLLEKKGLKNIHELKDDKIAHPDIFVVIDELADLVYSDKKEIEPLLIKIATLGRACGIHLIVATQRPTVDVVCGQLKANIDTRLALRVASIRDSINIIDRKGAEELKGAGDGLLKIPTQANEIPIQVAYISDKNIKGIVEYKKRGYYYYKIK